MQNKKNAFQQLASGATGRSYRSWICIEEHTIDKGRDITELETKPTERQSKVNCIRVEALERIFKSS